MTVPLTDRATLSTWLKNELSPNSRTLLESEGFWTPSVDLSQIFDYLSRRQSDLYSADSTRRLAHAELSWAALGWADADKQDLSVDIREYLESLISRLIEERLDIEVDDNILCAVFGTVGRAVPFINPTHHQEKMEKWFSRLANCVMMKSSQSYSLNVILAMLKCVEVILSYIARIEHNSSSMTRSLTTIWEVMSRLRHSQPWQIRSILVQLLGPYWRLEVLAANNEGKEKDIYQMWMDLMQDGDENVRLAVLTMVEQLWNIDKKRNRDEKWMDLIFIPSDNGLLLRHAAKMVVVACHDRGFDLFLYINQYISTLEDFSESELQVRTHPRDIAKLRAIVTHSNLLKSESWAVRLLRLTAKLFAIRKSHPDLRPSIKQLAYDVAMVLPRQILNYIQWSMLRDDEDDDSLVMELFTQLHSLRVPAQIGQQLLCTVDIPTDNPRSMSTDQLLANLAHMLAVPPLFANNMDDDPSTETLTMADKFRRRSQLFFEFIHVVISGLTAEDQDAERLSDKTMYHLLVSCATFLGDERKRWCDEASHRAAEATLSCLLSYAKKTDSRIQRIPHLVNRYSERILEEHIKPYFRHAKVDDTGHRVIVKKGTRQPEDELGRYYDQQPWKVEKVECVEILSWTILQLEHGQFGPLQHHIFPALLQLLDDYDPIYKAIGVRLIQHAIVENSTPMDIRRTGLGDVFFESLLPCLTYHSDQPLLFAAITCIVDIIPVIEVKDSEVYHDKLGKLVEDGILRNLTFAIGGNFMVIRALIRTIPKLVSLLDVVGIRFLQPLLGISCEILELHQHDVTTQLAACDAIMALMRQYWPRIHAYRGLILKSAAHAWRGIMRGEKGRNDVENQDLREALKGICTLLREICRELVEADFKLLLHMDREMYGSLVGH
ncbi:uncharacterized protein SPPG_07531 [Spizellomyces punctatus DAOM BR117]|uniref:Uncharacterized protein n=1 Tax=Spizellomyces punctatus (strain DAOM BR117) TaxID=645134 RepID=A0A0L0H6M9_SPIPD|nr:uncharacterized protein SPPG_07531 [Spizellomyces punctatus DAOM BR117]KNC97140.1 hypothetical protein SPPG_07531 [Spizellomyces punctatus DAOM BR117]|eukprot:XP_016605180.1 hypothetical protein SPPG_07531 [Spizellomyces punctatus DAOM BR117]